MQTKKFLDKEGVKTLWEALSLQDYPNNEILIAVINAINAEIEALKQTTVSIENVFPVGSIYLSVNAINPGTLFHIGEWEQIKDTFLLSAGDTYLAGTTGGEARHTLTEEEMPEHCHALKTDLDNDYNQSWVAWKEYTTGWTQSPLPSRSAATYTTESGESKSHNNMPPYLAVYVWKRVK